MKYLYHSLSKFLERQFKVDARYFLKGGFWLILAQAVTIISSLVAAVIFARVLPENEYGVYRYVISLSILLSAFSLTGAPQAILQAAAKGYGRFIVDSTKPVLIYSFGITAISLLGALYYQLNDNQLLATGCLIIGFLQPISQFFMNVQSYMYGEARFVSGSLLQVTKSIAISGSSLIALFLTNDIITLILVFFIAQSLSGTFSYLTVYKQVRNKKFDDSLHQKYLSFAKHTSIRNWFVHVANQFDSIFVFQQLGAADLALYSISTLLPTHIRGTFKNLQTLLLPKYSKHESHTTLRKYIPKRSLQLFLLLCSISGIFIVVAPYIFDLLFPTYPEATLYAQLLALTFPASVSLIPFGAMQALHMEKELYLFQVSTSVIQFVLVLLLVTTLGFVGAIISRIIIQYSRAAIAYALLYKN